MDLKGKVAVITGASSGIGAGLARHLVEQGMRVGLCSRRAPVLEEGPNVLSRSVDGPKRLPHFTCAVYSFARTSSPRRLYASAP